MTTNTPTFQPDTSGLFVAALDCTPRNRHMASGVHGDLLHRLIGREIQPDGSALLVVLPYQGRPRTVGADEPHRILSYAEARTFDLAAWQRTTRQADADRQAAAGMRLRRQSMREALEHQLVIATGAREVRIGDLVIEQNNEGHRFADELIAEGLARTLDEGLLVTTHETTVELSAWPYLGRTGPARFTPAAPGVRVLVYGCPSGGGGTLGRAGRCPVAGYVTAGRDRWVAYAAHTHTGRQLELIGPGVPGAWEESVDGLDVAEWIEWQRDAAEAVERARQVEAIRSAVVEQLRTAYAITPTTDAELAVCQGLAAQGECYEVEGSFVLAKAPRA